MGPNPERCAHLRPLGSCATSYGLALGIPQPQGVLHQFNHVAIGVMNVGGVPTAVATDRGRSIRDFQRLQVGYHFIPVVYLQGEMPRRVGGWRKSAVDFPAPDSQLQLSLVQFRATVEKFGAQDSFVPLAGPLLVADLEIDVLDHRNPGHESPPYDLMIWRPGRDRASGPAQQFLFHAVCVEGF